MNLEENLQTEPNQIGAQYFTSTIHFKLSAAHYYINHPGKVLTINKSNVLN
jgi:hypothetical protein